MRAPFSPVLTAPVEEQQSAGTRDENKAVLKYWCKSVEELNNVDSMLNDIKIINKSLYSRELILLGPENNI